MLSNVQSGEISAGNESTQLLVSQHAVASFAPRRAALNTVDMDRLWWVEQVLNERKTSFDFKMMMCCLLVLDSVTSTPQWIRKPRPRNMLLVFRIRTTFGAVVRKKRRE